MMRGLLFIIGVLSCFMGGIQSAAAQTNEYHWVNVCNRGDVDLKYVVLATRWNLGQGDRAQLSGWHTIRKGKCEDVSILTYQAVTIGFVHERAQGGLGNPVYVPSDATPANGNKYAPAVLCVPESGSIRRKGSLSSVLSAASPPCANGEYELQMPFYEKPGNFVPKFIVRPSTHESLAPWPQELNQPPAPAPVSPPPQPSPAPQTKTQTPPPTAQSSSAADIDSVTATLKQRALRRQNYTTLCRNSLFSSYFQMNGAGADTACPCFVEQLINYESADTLDAIDRALRGGKRFDLLGDKTKIREEEKPDFDTIIKKTVREENTSKYIAHCIAAQK